VYEAFILLGIYEIKKDKEALAKGARSGAVVEALRYKPEGRAIDSRWCHWNFSLT
jgi:hypothetical protein